MEKKASVSGILINAVVLLSVFLTLYPFVHILILSVSSYEDIIRNRIFFLPSHIDLSAYETILRSDNVSRSLANSILYTVAGTLLSVLATVTMAYPLSKRNLTGRRLFLFLVTFTLLFGVGMVPLYLIVRNLRMINTIWAILFPFLISPWNLILTRTFFESIPEGIQQSASLEGAGDLRVLASIVVPMSTPIIATISLYYAVGYWNSYFWPMIFLNRKSMFPIQIILREIVIQGTMATEISNAAGDEILMTESIKGATIMVATLPIILVYPFLQRYFVKGILVGAIKG